MKGSIKRSFLFFLFLILLVFTGISSTANVKIKVIVEKAKIHLEPDPNSPVLVQAARDVILEVTNKVGQWYFVTLPPDENGYTRAGYIHQNMAEEISYQAPQPSPPPSYRAGDAKDLEQLVRIEKTTRQHSIAFLSLIKQMDPEETSGFDTHGVDMVRVVIDGSSVYETMDSMSNVIYSPRINDEFEVRERNDGFYKILLFDGREGWISEQCIQPFSGQKREAQIRFRGIQASEVKKFIETASSIFEQISQQKILADQIYKKYASAGTEASLGLQAAYLKIQKYYDYAYQFYRKFVENKSFLAGTKDSPLLTKLSAWTELLFGSSSFSTEYLNQNPEKNSGFIRDLTLGANVVLGESSKLDVKFANKKDIIQTPYSTTTVDAGYSYTNDSGLNFKTGINYNTYNDDLTDLNDYTRLTLAAGGNYLFNQNSKLLFDYSYLQNSFSMNEGNNYASHKIFGAFKLKSNTQSEFTVQMLSNLQTSDQALFNSTNFVPSITYDRYGGNSQSKFSFLYDMFSYPDLDLRSYNRAVLSFRLNTRAGGSSKSVDLSATAKRFPQNKGGDYIQLQGRYASTKGGSFNTVFRPSIYSNLYTTNTANSYTELRLDLGGNTQVFFSHFSTYFRLWHNPGDPDEGQVKPHVFDLYGKIGLSFKYIRIGPTVGIHALFSSDQEEFFKRDGNLIRFGGIVEGNIPFPRGIKLAFSGSYEYGFVYNDEISINPNTGEFDRGELLQRHPTTLQGNAVITVPVYKSFELIGRANFYKINTDMDEKISINPMTQNTRFTFLVGLKYRYN
jgi:hypothetical protein